MLRYSVNYFRSIGHFIGHRHCHSINGAEKTTSTTFAQDKRSLENRHSLQKIESKKILDEFKHLKTHSRNDKESIEQLCNKTLANFSVFSSIHPDKLTGLARALVDCKVPLSHQLFSRTLSKLAERCSVLNVDKLYYLSAILKWSYYDTARNENRDILEKLLPMIFQVKHVERINFENVDEVLAALKFVLEESYPERFTKRTINGIISSLRFHGENLDRDTAIRTIATITNSTFKSPSVDALLKNAVKSMEKVQLTLKDVNILITNLTENRYPASFYETSLFDKCINIFIEQEKDTNRLISTLTDLLQIDFVSQKLTERICENIETIDWTIYDAYYTLTACKKLNLTPSNWSNVFMSKFEQFNLPNEVEKVKINWPMFVVLLKHFGYENSELTEKVLTSNNQFFKKRCRNALDELSRQHQLRTNDCVGQVLQNLIGENKLLKNVNTKYDIKVDYVLKINTKTGIYLPLDGMQTDNVLLDAIEVRNNEMLIGIHTKPFAKEQHYKLRTIDWTLVSLSSHELIGKTNIELTSHVIQEISRCLKRYEEKKLKRNQR